VIHDLMAQSPRIVYEPPNVLILPSLLS
jgi:hypothetical protein